VLLALAEAARRRRPVAMRYAGRDGTPSERTVEPYGLVVHSARWYVTGADSASGEVRTFRLDRVLSATVLPGSFEVPAGFDPAAAVLAGLAAVPRRHTVSVRVRGTVEHVGARIPAGIATTEPLDTDHTDHPDDAGGWVRVQLRAERLDWVPSLLAWVDRPFVIERPEALRGQVHALADRLAASADAAPDP
jgi:predicted DNA-binding transcriptional regulator YafY